jgi:fluoride exporter
MRIFLLVVLGAAGTLARYALQGVVQYRAGPRFPWGTLAVNLGGCLLTGLIGQFALRHLTISPDWRVGVTVWILWSLHYFFHFWWETVRMLEDGEWEKAALMSPSA